MSALSQPAAHACCLTARRPLLLCLAAVAAGTALACGPAGRQTDSPGTSASQTGSQVSFFTPSSSTVPNDVVIPGGLSPQDQLTPLAEFAWQEFIALNWPSSYDAPSDTRGQPDTNVTVLDFTQFDASQPLVWQTYFHRVEIYPMGVDSGGTTTYPNYPASFNTPPQYYYRGVSGGSIPACGGSGPPLDQLDSYFNNLDETTEINLATVFVDADPEAPGEPPPVNSPFYSGLPRQPRRFIYQAKANQVMFDYVTSENLYQQDARTTLLANTYVQVNENGMGGIAPCPNGVDIICFPPGELATGGRQGSIEIKATWRQLTLEEYESGRFVTGPILRYRNPDPAQPTSFCYELIAGTPTATSLPYGLVGLHIIHKTTNVPTYVFATFEQVDNLDRSKPHNQIFFYNRNAGIVNPGKQYVTSRAHPIPPQVVAVNQTVHQQLRDLIEGTYDDSVWLYYQLIGVQGPTLDFVEGTDYFLANVTTETNEALRSFSGTLDNNTGTIDPSHYNLYAGSQSHTAGGCKGCHGNAQIGNSTSQQAADFSFITLNAPFDGVPDAVNQPLLKSRPQWYLDSKPPPAAATGMSAASSAQAPSREAVR